MFYKSFAKDDVIYNTVVTYPECEFFVANQVTFLNRETLKNGNFSNKVKHVTQGSVSLLEANINRPSDNLISPFFIWDGLRQNMFGFDAQDQSSVTLLGGQQIDGVYPMSASISRIYFDPSGVNTNLKYINALRNPIDLSGELSSKHKFSDFDLANDKINVIAIPSIFYGSGLKRGSLKLDFFVTGSLTATLEDTRKNGELVETHGPNKGQVAGIALYDYGLLVLTGSASLHPSHTDNYFGSSVSPSWLSFGSGIPEVGRLLADSGQNVSSAPSYNISFKGKNKIPTMTLIAHANRAEHNYSTNPTFIDKNTPRSATSAKDKYVENVSLIKNIRKSKHAGFEEDFENTTYISQIGVYDDSNNLIAVAKLASPVKKTEIQDYMFKLRMDF